MAQQNINVGTSANDGTGDTLRDSQIKANSNFTELYTNKVDKVLGKGLSENDYTNAEQTKLAGIETGAEVNVQADFAQTDSLADDYIKNKPDSLYASVGFFDYNDLNTQTSPLVLTAGVPYKITNDTLGAFTNITNAPYGVSSIWDAVNNAFDFSELSIGDTIDIRNDLQITTIGSNENVKMFFRLAAGSPSEYDLYFYDKNFKTAGVNVIQDFTSIYIGSQDFIDYPTEFYIVGDNGGSVKVNGWYTRILLKDVNIVSFSDPTKKIKLESNKYNDLLLSGSDALIDLRPDGSSYYEFSNVGLVSLKGFDFTSLDLAPSGEYPYEGKDFVLKNSTGSDITLKENILLGTQIPFRLSGGVDATMPDGGLIWFKVVNGIVEAEEIMRSWTSGGGGGATAFTSLTDVPSSYTGHANKVVSVKTDESGLEFTTGGAGDPSIITLSLPAFAVTRSSSGLFYRQGTNQDRPIFNTSTGVTDHTLLGSAIGISTCNFIVPFNCRLKSVIYQENIANFELSIYKTESLTNPAVDATEIFYEASAGATVEQYALSGTAIDAGNLISTFIKIDAGTTGTSYARLFLTFEKI